MDYVLGKTSGTWSMRNTMFTAATLTIAINRVNGILNMMLGWGTYSGQFTYSITEVFYYITVVLIFVFYLLLVFTFYIFTSQGDRTYRRVRYNDPAVDNLLEIVSNEL